MQGVSTVYSMFVSGYLEVFMIKYVFYFYSYLFEHLLLKVLLMYFICLFCKIYQRNRLLDK